jgi:hypothetical protein
VRRQKRQIFIIEYSLWPNEPRLPPMASTGPVGTTGEPNHQASRKRFQTKMNSEVHDSLLAARQLLTLEKVEELREDVVHRKLACNHHIQQHQEILGPI